LATKKKPSANGRKAFFLVPKKCENRHILKKKKSKVAIFRQSVSICHQNWAGIFFLNLLYCQIYSQIWLIPLVDDRQKRKRRKRQDQKKLRNNNKLEQSEQRSNGAGEWHASGSSSRGDDGGRSGDGISEWTWPGKALELGSKHGQTSGTGSRPRAQHAVPEGA
jgi:hypothetical protein